MGYIPIQITLNSSEIGFLTRQLHKDYRSYENFELEIAISLLDDLMTKLDAEGISAVADYVRVRLVDLVTEKHSRQLHGDWE
jgi:hypothetical protein